MPVTLTHLDADGRVHMVDVGGKTATRRLATAEGWLSCSAEALAMVCDARAPKGAVIATAEVAGTMAAKRTSDLIPLCHPLALEKVMVRITPVQDPPGFWVRAEAQLTGVTGVEMEALTAVSVACLTLYDMLKAADKGMQIREIGLVSKTGGKSGDWRRG